MHALLPDGTRIALQIASPKDRRNASIDPCPASSDNRYAGGIGWKRRAPQQTSLIFGTSATTSPPTMRIFAGSCLAVSANE